MLAKDMRDIGHRLWDLRHKRHLTQWEVAEKAELSNRTYADIERGTVNMRVETLLKICHALDITPNDILLAENEDELLDLDQGETMRVLSECSAHQRRTALQMLSVYLKSLQ